MITVKRYTDGRPQTKRFESEVKARAWMGEIEEFTVQGEKMIFPSQGSKWFYNTKRFEMEGV